VSARQTSGEPPLVTPDEVGSWLAALPRPVAVTGGTGFVGSHLVDTLCAAGLEPRVLVRQPERARWIAGAPARFVPGALDDPDALGRLVEGAGTVVHLAGVVRAGRTERFEEANRVGTANLVAAIRSRAPEARLVHVSSLAAAGPSPTPEGLGPEAEPRPVSAYGRSKLGAEREVAGLGRDTRWSVLRPPAIYGPRDTDVLAFFRMAALGVAAVPSGSRWISVAFVGDVVRAVFAAAARGEATRTYHLGEPEGYEIGDLVRRLALAGGVPVRVVRVPGAVLSLAGAGGSVLHRLGLSGIAMTRDKARELTARHWTAASRSSLEALGLGPGVPFDEGSRLTWAWYREMGWVR
jgi:nucleoside-diphosphate-sugar epimerase